jgi:thiamine-phosphate pyrophosphorylase
MFESSPAVERAQAAALVAAKGIVSNITLTHWFLALLEDEDGRPAAVVGQLGLDLEYVRQTIQQLDASSPLAPPSAELFRTARGQSIALRNDPLLTTDFILLALVLADEPFAAELAASAPGLTSERIGAVLRTTPDALESPPFELGPTLNIADTPEVLSAARVVDANLNRSREAFRVLDDYARFTRNDRDLAEQCKTLRHQLATATNLLPASTLLAARDTPNDVGREITTSSEYSRTSPVQVATVNLKRLQESLRSLEEFGKVLSAEFARAIETIRYESYTLERILLRTGDKSAQLATAKLYVLLTGSQCMAALDWTIQQAADGGADLFQLREKTLTDRELLERAKQVRHWTRRAGVLFIVNDRPDIALLAEADGIHLGQDDIPVAVARRIVGPNMLIGLSTHNLDQVRGAVRDGADYLGVGPTFPSSTKSFQHFPGLGFVREAFAETSRPAFALGGIDLKNVAEVAAAGARGIAVSSAIATADDPQAVAVALKRAITG